MTGVVLANASVKLEIGLATVPDDPATTLNAVLLGGAITGLGASG